VKVGDRVKILDPNKKGALFTNIKWKTGVIMAESIGWTPKIYCVKLDNSNKRIWVQDVNNNVGITGICIAKVDTTFVFR
jgi:hypothetical protein